MQGLWTFSPSSELLLQQCIELSGRSNNKWSQLFPAETVAASAASPAEVMDLTEECSERINIEAVDTEASYSCDELIKSLCEIIEHDLAGKFSYVQHECSLKIWPLLAASLSHNALDKLYAYLLGNPNNIEEDFVRNCMCYTFPLVLSTEKSWYCIDLLKNVWKQYKALFMNIILPLVLKNTTIPSNILHDFLLIVSTEDKNNIFSEIVEVKLSFEEFQHHISTIHLLFKETEDNGLTSSYILTYLESFYEKCSNDKNFGRLLLLYLQKVRTVPVGLEKIIEDHKSAFKRPCLVAYNKLR